MFRSLCPSVRPRPSLLVATACTLCLVVAPVSAQQVSVAVAPAFGDSAAEVAARLDLQPAAAGRSGLSAAAEPSDALVSVAGRGTATPPRIVSNLNPSGWLIGPFVVDEMTDEPLTEFAAGPGTPPLGAGSYRAQIVEAGSKIILLRNDYHDVRLDRLEELSYWTYVSSAGSNTSNWYVNLYVDADGDGSYETRLDYVPPSGDVVIDTWQQWDARAGDWNVSTGGTMTIDDFLVANPDARINAFDTPEGGALRFNMGDTAASYVGFDGNLDGIRVAFSGGDAVADDLTWDFEPKVATKVQSVGASRGTATPSDNDYTRINDAIQAMAPGDTVVLEGTFDWTEANAAASWALGSDGTPETDDDYTINAPALNDGTLTAESLGDARIQGPGDVEDVDLEGFLLLWLDPLDFKGWTVSNLEIFDFDLSIGLFHTSGGTVDRFDDVVITNNHIRMPNDLLASDGDAFQNIGIHFAFGDSQTISDNLIEIPGDSSSDSVAEESAASVAMQSNTAGTPAAYDGLRITGNRVHVLNAPAADPELVFGIWENGGSHGADIEIAGNEFVNLSPLNDPANNLQRAFRIHSQSGPVGASETPSVRYLDNLVVGADIGFKWIEGFGSDWDFSPHGPVLLRQNTVLGNGTGIAVRSAGEGRLRCNRIAGNSVGVSGFTSGSGIEFEDAEGIDAADNWWGCNQGPDVGLCDTTDGFSPIDSSSWFELQAGSVVSVLAAGEGAPVLAELASNGGEPPGCTFPDGATASFSALNGSMSPETAPVLAGETMSTYTAGGVEGLGFALVAVDQETVPVQFVIQAIETDLTIEATSAPHVVDIGDVVTVTVEVSNLGPSDVEGASVTKEFPEDLTDCSWTCVDIGDASCDADSGTGDLDETVDFAVGAAITYTATCEYLPDGTPDDVVIPASVAVPDGLIDTNPDNNSALAVAIYVANALFIDGFESGDTTAWQ